MTFGRFEDMFAAATDGHAPFDWQRRFAAAERKCPADHGLRVVAPLKHRFDALSPGEQLVI